MDVLNEIEQKKKRLANDIALLIGLPIEQIKVNIDIEINMDDDRSEWYRKVIHRDYGRSTIFTEDAEDGCVSFHFTNKVTHIQNAYGVARCSVKREQ